MTRVPANLPPSLLALNPHIAETAVRKGNILHAQRLAGCPPADLDEQERRSMQAAAARAAGASLEAWINAQHDDAIAMGLADVEHTNPPFTVTGDLGRGLKKGFFGAKSGPDYRGVLRGGRGFAVESKNAGRHRLELVEPPEGDPRRERFEGLKQHQRDALERCHLLGGVALVVVRFKRRLRCADVETTYVVPWGRVREFASIGPDDVGGCEAPAGCYLKPYVEGV